MMNAYGKYAQERNSSWKVLVDCEIDYLPVDVIKIAYRNNIKVFRNTTVRVLKPSEYGQCIFKDGMWAIVYDNTQSNEEMRYTIAHELGHIFLGHETKVSRKSEINEAAADSFAQKLLAPACVLKELEIYNQEDIAKVCDIPDWVASRRAERLKELLERNKFYKSHIEVKVKEKFDKFITEEKERRANKTLF